MLVVRGNKPNQTILDKLKQDKNVVQTAVTIGNFDGVHKGHQEILKRLSKLAEDNNLLKVVITFEPRPVDYFTKLKSSSIKNSRISLLLDKLKLLKKQKIDLVWVINFNSQTANTSAEDFLANINSFLKIKYLFIGQDFRFGKNRAGDISLLQEFSKQNSINLNLISDFEINKTKISSSLIRDILSKDYKSIVESNIALNITHKYLGRLYGFTGKVIKGQQKGRLLGYPTVNIHVKPKQLLLAKGVYAVHIYLNHQKYNAMANWGIRPTVADKLELVLEAHIFDFEQEVYGQQVYIEFIAKTRAEQKFESLEGLIEQLGQDKLAVQKYF
jgi:riboflavin kinase/FMN adenylyltransferase